MISYLVIHANMTLIITLITLIYDIAARLPVQVQEDSLLSDLHMFFAKLHVYYKTLEDSHSIFHTILLQVKDCVIFQKQRQDPSLTMYSFKLLELLRGMNE